ncbi:MAG: hypothetical protein JWO86_7235 [Myxococcaceae bacterium]|nr:hypothetical protein [Myxococcaceae bacterium]
MLHPSRIWVGSGLVSLVSLVSSLAGCTANGRSDAPSGAAAPARSVSCAEGAASGPTAYDVTIDDRRTTLAPMPPLAVVSMGKDRPPYAMKLEAETCGPRAQLVYSVTRMATPESAALLLADLGPPPGAATTAPALPAAAAAADRDRVQHVAGSRAVMRGEEVVLGEGVWGDGEPYRVSVTVR